jgi:hypothetical protein
MTPEVQLEDYNNLRPVLEGDCVVHRITKQAEAPVFASKAGADPAKP